MKEHYDRDLMNLLEKATAGLELTNTEKQTLKWLATWDSYTVNNIVSIIKKARGQMLNQMILQEIETLDELKTLNIDGFTYNPQYDQEGTLAFVKERT